MCEPMGRHFPKVTGRQTDFYLLGFFTVTFDAQINLALLVRSDGLFNATGYADPRVDQLIDAVGTELSSPCATR